MRALFLVVLLACGCAQAGDRVYKLALVGVPGFLDSQQLGAGAKFSNALVKRLQQKGLQFEVTYFEAAKRAAMAFASGEYDVLFPAGLGDPNIPGVPSAAVVGEQVVLFTHKNKPPLNRVSELEGKTLGIPRGYFLPSHIASNSKIAIREANSMQGAFLMLSRNRLDSVLALKSVGDRVVRSEKLNSVTHGKVVDFAFGVFMFHDTAEGKTLLEIYNHELGGMFKDGSYRRLMQDSPHSLL